MRSIKRRSLSVKAISTITFALAMLVSICIIAFLVFASWISSSGKVMRYTANDLNKNLYQRIDTFVLTSEAVNRYNGSLLAYGTLNLADANARDRFFASVLGSHDGEIFRFGFGTADGAFYGATKVPGGGIEIFRQDETTGGIVRHYRAGEDLSAGELMDHAEVYDCRTQPWYTAAVKAKGTAFAQVYLDYTAYELMVSAGRPLYDEAGELLGVLVADIRLSDLARRLWDAAGADKGYAFVVEKKTGALIANSIGYANFSFTHSGGYKRYTLDDIKMPAVAQAFEQYKLEASPELFVRTKDVNLYVNARGYQREGLDWVILTAIPESFLMAEVIRNIERTIFLVIIAIVLSLAIYIVIARRLFQPMNNLLEVAEHIASGNLSERASVVRQDEIGRISCAFNQTADKMLYLINHLEDMVKLKTADMEGSKNQLRLLLDSTAEAIYGVDLDGNCTFCNKNCLKVLGYAGENELLGKNMHRTMHHTKADGTPFPAEECGITNAVRLGVGKNADDEVFWRADGSWFFAEYHAYPQIQEGRVIGAVITFMDITQRKKHDEQIRYLSSHDVLTGLFNRGYFQEAIKQMDVPANLPLSVVFADLNGLKMTNDIFGHEAGDALIIKAAEILILSCRADDMVARIGGDEFVLLLPGTDMESAQTIIDRIRLGFADARVAAVKCSISLGCDTKESPDTPIEETIANAENMMYKDKTLNRKLVNKGMIDTIMETLHEKSPKEKQHSIGVSGLCERIGAAMHMTDADVAKLRRAGYLHDIGKITLNEHVLHWDDLTEPEREKIQQHSAVGYRILNLFDDTLDLAEGVYSHHERWDGAGYPKGLKGNDIPLISRVISIAETYDRVFNDTALGEHIRKEMALDVIRQGAGKQFDPLISESFIEMILKNE